ncbi:hypothetical protein DL96DRAFT_1778455 [Flagelloscypha sp. PMI_526]|nr:hypothetical protein DL96DRAFT_1778455 [Flagelloscypha sp. PMI_526]
MLASTFILLSLTFSALGAVLPRGVLDILPVHKRALLARLDDLDVYIGFDPQDEAVHLYHREDGYVGQLTVAEVIPHLTRRGVFDVPPGCFLMGTEQIDSLNGKDKLGDKAQECFGGQGKRRFTNPTDQDVCTRFPLSLPFPSTLLRAWETWRKSKPGAAMMVRLLYKTSNSPGSQSAPLSTNLAKVEPSGTSATLKFENQLGSKATSSYSVTNAAEGRFETTFGLPAIASTKQTIKFSVNYKHEDNRVTTKEVNTLKTQSITFVNPDNNNCNSKFTTESCTANAQGNIRTLAGGWIWFEFDGGANIASQCHGPKQPAPAADEKRFKWAMPLLALSKEDRTMLTPMSSESQVDTVGTKYWVECVDAKGNTKKQDLPTDAGEHTVTLSGAEPTPTDSTPTETADTPAPTDPPVVDPPVDDTASDPEAPTDDPHLLPRRKSRRLKSLRSRKLPTEPPVDDSLAEPAVAEAPTEPPAEETPVEEPPAEDLPAEPVA